MIKTIYKDKSYSVEGPASILFETGKYSVTGKIFTKGSQLSIPENRTYYINVIETGKIELTGREQNLRLIELQESNIPRNWELLEKRLNTFQKAPVLILGRPNTGKTFLTTYLLNRLMSNKKVSILDCDINQTLIAPPAVLGIGIPDTQVLSLSSIKPFELYFIGSHSSYGHITPFLIGIKKLATTALINSDILLVDTTGFISGDSGRLLKKSIIELLKPELIILLQTKNELEHLVRNEDRRKIFRLPAADIISKIPVGMKKSIRENSMKELFKNGSIINFSFNNVRADRTFFNTGKYTRFDNPHIIHAEELSDGEGILVVTRGHLPDADILKIKKEFGNIKIVEDGSEKNVLVGLANQDRKTIALGIIEKINYTKKTIRILSYCNKPEDVKLIQFGSLRYSFDGCELAAVKPGYF